MTTYTAAPQLRDPLRLMRDMVQDLGAARWLAWRLLVRNLSARYRQSLLGYFWAIVPPALHMLVFVYLNRAGYFSVGATPLPYPVFLLSGLILWQAFCDAVHMPLRMVQQSHTILTKVNFPREALLLAGLGEIAFGFVIRAMLLLPVLWWYEIEVSWQVLLAPVGLFLLIVLGVTLGLLITPLGLLYQDVSQGIPLVLSLWMFLTPVIYPADTAAASPVMAWNPVAPVLDAARGWLLSTNPETHGAILVIGVVALLALLFGWLLYRLALPILIERIGA